MRLTEISASRLKSLRDLRLRVGPLVALTGPNGSGKTAILQAVRLAILGYEPSVGKTLAATKTLYADGQMASVGLVFDDGFTIGRSFSDSISTTVMPLRGESTERARQARIEAETGAFLPSFDFQAFLELSAEKRREMLFALLPRDAIGLTLDDWREWLGYEFADPSIQAAIDKLWREHIERAPSPLDGLGSAISYVHERKLAAERDRKKQELIAQEASAAAQRETEAASHFNPLEQTRLQRELEQVTEAFGRVLQQAEEAEREKRRARQRDQQLRVIGLQIKEATANLETARVKLASLRNDPVPELDSLLARLLDAERERDALPQPSEAEIEAARQAVVEAEEALRSRQEEARQAGERRTEAMLRAAPARRSLEQLAAADQCPVCGAVAELEAVRERLRREVEAADQQQAILDRQHREAVEAVKLAEETVRAATERLKQLQAQTDAHLYAEIKVERIRENVEWTRSEHERRQAEAEQEVARLEAEIQRLEEESDRLNAIEILTEFPDYEGEMMQLEARSATLREGLRKIQEAAKAAGRAEAARQRADEEAQQLKTLTARAEALDWIYGALQRLRADAIQKLVSPVEQTANEILREIDPGKTFRFQFEAAGGRPTFDFGFEQDGIFRPFDAASTGEDAFLAVVLIAALVAAVRPRWRVLMVDNLESIDETRRAALLSALARVADRYFDNVLVAGCCWIPAVDGWQVVDVAELTAAMATAAA